VLRASRPEMLVGILQTYLGTYCSNGCFRRKGDREAGEHPWLDIMPDECSRDSPPGSDATNPNPCNNPSDLLRLVENRGHLGRYGVRGSLAPWEQGPAGSEPLPGASGVCQSFSNLCPSHPAIDFQGAAVIP
jgi:hypothetical protein